MRLANTDGSVQGDPLAAGIGISFRTREGDFKLVVAMRIKVTKIIWAESFAIIKAAEIAASFQHSKSSSIFYPKSSPSLSHCDTCVWVFTFS